MGLTDLELCKKNLNKVKRRMGEHNLTHPNGFEDPTNYCCDVAMILAGAFTHYQLRLIELELRG